MKLLRNSIIISCIMLLFGSCCGQNKEKAFLAQYEFEDFSQFNGVSVFIRGGDRESIVIMLDAPHFVKDTSRIGLYIVTLNRKNHQIIEGKWSLTEHYVEADTLKLQQLAQTFMKYKIPRMDVDTAGNVFIYLKDVETIALVRFANEDELKKRSRESTWTKVKNTDNWYK